MVYSSYSENAAYDNYGEEKAFRYAVTELKTWLPTVTGASSLEVKYVDNLSLVNEGDENYFVLGCELAKLNGYTTDGLTTETGYVIQKNRGNVYLYGKTGYGTLKAVYALLKQVSGLEFYTGTDYTYTETAFDYDKVENTVFNPSIDRNWASGSLEDAVDEAGNIDWAHVYRLGYVNPSQVVNGGYHNWYTLTYDTCSSNTNWYTNNVVTINGTDDSGTYRALNLAYGLTEGDGEGTMVRTVANNVYNEIEAQDKEKNKKDQFYFGQEDNWTWSNSAESQALKDKYGTYSAESILFINKVAELLDKNYDSLGRKIRLVIMAYNQTLEAPNYDKFGAELKFYSGTNFEVGVMFAPVESNLYRSAEDTTENGIYEGYEVYEHSNKWYADQLREWKKFADGRISVYYYSAHYDNYFVPLDSIKNMQSKYQLFAENGVTDLTDMGQYAKGSEYTDWNDLKLYMKSKYAEDATRTDGDTLIRKFCDAYYGNGNTAIGEIMYNFYVAESAQYEYIAKQFTENDASGCHLIRGTLFDKKYWSTEGNGKADLLKSWCKSINEAAKKASDAFGSDSEYVKRIKREAISIRYLLVGLFEDKTYDNSMSDLATAAKGLGITQFAEGAAYTIGKQESSSGNVFKDWWNNVTSDNHYGGSESGKIENLK